MYETHPTFLQPESENIKVWRYLDFTKFLSLIDSSCLYFTRVDKFDDPFEGSWPKLNVEEKLIVSGEHKENGQKSFLEVRDEKSSDFNKNWLRYIAVNCWHENEHESAAMWKLYLKSNEGIAIQSTYDRLKKSIIDRECVYLGRVKYIDYEAEFMKTNSNILGPFVHKRKSFEYEKEIRVVIVKWPIVGDTLDFSKETIINGLPIKVEIESLIQKIYVAPNAPTWFSTLVRKTVKRYGYDFVVIHSQMDSIPLF